MSRTALLAAALALAACGSPGDAPVAETTAVTDDGTLTFAGTPVPLAEGPDVVTWTGAKITGSHDGGFRTVDGELYLDGETVTGADVRIDARSIYSDNDDLTGHLMSADFFEVDTYPEASFQTTALRALAAADSVDWSEATHLVTGRLTMHGQTNEITFPAVVSVTPEAATVQAAFNVERARWGLEYPGKPDDLIHDEVQIRIDARADRTAAGA